jgi:ferredoxin-type protein NapH
LLLISFLLFPVTLFYFSPYLVIMGGFSGLITGSALIFATQFVTSLIFGRAFCGWICPAGCLQDYCSEAAGKRISGKINLIKYIIWVPWLLFIILAFIMAGGIKGLDFFYMTENGISAADPYSYIGYFFIIALIIIIALLTGKRGMCHSVCWMAPFMILGTKIKNRLGYPALHLEAKPESCVKCGSCSKNCPMSLDVEKMVLCGSMANSECILCGMCADSCRKDVIGLTFKRRTKVSDGIHK